MGAPPTPEVSPLTGVDLDKINQGIAHAQKALAQVELAKRAGLPVDQQEAQAKAALDQLIKMKQVYFPTAQ